MKSTRYVEPFKNVVDEWEMKLNFVSEVVENILQVQKKWIYLENIFRGDEIRREMKKEVASFKIISEGMKELASMNISIKLASPSISIPVNSR